MEAILNATIPIFILLVLLMFLALDIRKQIMELRYPEESKKTKVPKMKNPPAPPDKKHRQEPITAETYCKQHGIDPSYLIKSKYGWLDLSVFMLGYAQVVNMAKCEACQVEKAFSEEKTKDFTINTLEAENRHSRERYKRILDDYKSLEAENQILKQNISRLNQHSYCQQCSPEHLEAMKEATKMWVELAKDLHQKMQDLENRANAKPSEKAGAYKCSTDFLIEKGYLHVNSKEPRLSIVSTDDLAGLLQEYANQAVRQSKKSKDV